MCKITKYKSCNPRTDKCMLNLIGTLNQVPDFKVLACCCGHGKYPMTIIYKDQFSNNINELMSGKLIPRIRNFYKRDKQGYYYIPETLENGKK